MDPHRSSARLQRGLPDGDLPRRGIVALALGSAGVMALIALYQTGKIRRLPDPPISIFDSERVTRSAQAYEHFGTPDGLLGLASYATTAALAAASGPSRPWLSVATAAKVTFDATMAAKLAISEWPRHKALCFWCLLATAMTFATLPLAWPEAIRAIRQLRNRPAARSLRQRVVRPLRKYAGL